MLYVITARTRRAPCRYAGGLAPRTSTACANFRTRDESYWPAPAPPMDSPDPGEAGFTGSVIVAEFPSLEDARAWIAADPYVTEGVFESHEVRPFVKVLP